MHTKGKWEVKHKFYIWTGNKIIANTIKEKDTKHIVHCVNNFKPMLEALKRTTSELCEEHPHYYCDSHPLIKQANQAIKNVTCDIDAEEEKT